ncbi:hypothetical protein [Roseomonas xinghualingensis]|uniref:hypothetical protein n=1 Tax=Roseomonas xinghualingensis TaxID=2986475 RepID=UPI0021F12E53|nr:hypothetical protein [Roseomonas sp. SXEYE001]MCV4206842.1 hypothetical protein [Roseomonas sp. SXEYE001]
MGQSKAWMSARPHPKGRASAAAIGLAAILALPASAASGHDLLIPVQGPAKSPAPPAATPPARGPVQPPAVALSAEEAARTQPLQPGRSVQVQLRRGQSAFFRAAPEAGEAWSVATRRLSRNTDTVMAALDARGEVLLEDDDGGDENLASRIEVQPGDGVNTIRVSTLEGAGGRFEVILTREQPLPPPDFATSQEAAASRPPLSLGHPVRVRLRRNQQAFFALPEDRRDVIALTRNLGRNADTVLALLNARGEVLAEDDDGGEGTASLLGLGQEAQGPLTLRASLLNGASGEFDLVLEREAATPQPDYPTTLDAARARGPLAPGVSVRITMGRNGQAIFALPENQPLTLATRNLSEGADTILALLDAQGEVLLEDDDGGDNLASRLSTADTGRPAAFVRAKMIDSARGSFELVAETAKPSTAQTVASSIEEAARLPALILGEAIRIRLAPEGEAILALPNDGRPSMAMTFDLGPQADTVLTLLDENGQEPAENDDAEGLASRLEVPARRPAYLRAKLVGEQGGAFSLVLIRPAP